MEGLKTQTDGVFHRALVYVRASAQFAGAGDVVDAAVPVDERDDGVERRALVAQLGAAGEVRDRQMRNLQPGIGFGRAFLGRESDAVLEAPASSQRRVRKAH